MYCDPDGYQEELNIRKTVTLKNSQTFENTKNALSEHNLLLYFERNTLHSASRKKL